MGYYYSGNSLKSGDYSADTLEWQKFLKENGYLTGDLDGYYGDTTTEATKAYQKAQGLDTDGIVTSDLMDKAGFKNYNVSDAVSWFDSDEYKKALDNLNTSKGKIENFTGEGSAWADIKKQLANYGDFKYDINTDALYQQFAERYAQMGDRAARDVMGQASALTGGYGNSYAQIAGQQTYQQYLEGINDKQDEFYQAALDRYNAGRQNLVNDLGILGSEYEMLLNDYDLAVDDYNQAANTYQALLENAEAERLAAAESAQATNTQIEEAKAAAKKAHEEDVKESEKVKAAQMAAYAMSGDFLGRNGKWTEGNNEDLLVSQVKELQEALGIEATGKYGEKSTAAANGMSANEAYKAFLGGEKKLKATANTDKFIKNNQIALDVIGGDRATGGYVKPKQYVFGDESRKEIKRRINEELQSGNISEDEALFLAAYYRLTYSLPKED